MTRATMSRRTGNHGFAAGLCRRWLGAVGAVTLMAGVAFASPASAEYKLQPGDTLEMTFVGMPGEKQRSVIGLDGLISFPLLGQVNAGGLTMSAVKESLRAKVNNRLYRQITQDGKENVIVLNADDLYINIAAYRPLYVSGDVTKAGEQEFRPGMTVRHAVSVAGGFDVMRFRIASPVDPIEFKGEYRASLAEAVRNKARIIRLQAEMDGKPEPDFSSISAPDLDPDEFKTILATERSQFTARKLDLEKEKKFLQESIVKAENRVNVTMEQRDREADAEKEDIAELDRVKELVQKGTAPITRVVDARRMSLFSATRVLQTATQVNALERERDELKRKLTRADDEFKILVLKELQDANVLLATAQAKADAAKEKLALAGNPRGIPSDEAVPRVTIFRVEDGVEQKIQAKLDTEVEPGDIIEVTVPNTRLFGLTTVRSN